MGFVREWQKGSHLTLRRAADGARVTIPMHDAIRIGTLASALKGANIALTEFLAAL